MYDHDSTAELGRLTQPHNRSFRAVLVATAVVPIIFADKFYAHFYAYLTGNILDDIIRKQWDIVVLSILLFLACLVPLSFRRKIKWTEYGLVGAFFISLFVEMYGIPFTVFLVQKWFYQPTVSHPAGILNFHLFGVYFGMDLPMTYAAIVITIGILLIVVGWITLYRGTKGDRLVTHGIYAVCRHPQYLGFIMVIVGWFIGWPTILTLVLSPLLVYKYIRTAHSEEREVLDTAQYAAYKAQVPFLI